MHQKESAVVLSTIIPASTGWVLAWMAVIYTHDL